MNYLKQITITLTAGFVLATIAPALNAQTTIANGQIPLAGSVCVPLSYGWCDTVTLTGRVRVRAALTAPAPDPTDPSEPMCIRIRLDQVFGIGTDTGLDYVATGYAQANLPHRPKDPVSLGFNLITRTNPSDPIDTADSILPLTITFRLKFNPDTGALSHVKIDSMSVPDGRAEL